MTKQSVVEETEGVLAEALRRASATAQFHTTAHPIIEDYDPTGCWCYVDEAFFDLASDTTRQDGPIWRYY